MNKCYYRIVWENYPSDKTPLNEQNLNKMDAASDEMDNRIISLDATKFDKSEAQLLVKYIEYDEDTGIFKVTHYNGASYTIDTLLEKLAINFDYDYQTQQLIIQLSDGEIKYVDLSALITQYEFLDSETIHFTIGKDGKVSASVIEGSIQEKHLRPDYLADIKVEAAKAQASETAAATSAANAKASETAAKESQTAAKTSETNAKQSEINAKVSETTAANAANEAKKSEDNAWGSAALALEHATDALEAAMSANDAASSAGTYAQNAKTSETNAKTSELNAQRYAEQVEDINSKLQGTLRPQGTITFAQLPTLANAEVGWMFNISNDFVTTADFAEGAGKAMPSGSNVYKTEGGKWDVLAGTQVVGVKGAAETDYRRGYVNMTPANIGAVSNAGGTMNGRLNIVGNNVGLYVFGSDQVHGVFVGVGTDGITRGIYDKNKGEWIICIETDGDVLFKGLADAAVKLNTARTIALTGAVTGNVNFDGSANVNIATMRRGLMVGNNTSTPYWYKIASVSITDANADRSIVFIVRRTYGNINRNGILVVNARTNGSKIIDSKIFNWVVADEGIVPDNFVLCHNNVTPAIAEIWVKIPNQYEWFSFTVLQEGNRVSAQGQIWTLYDYSGTSSVGSSAPTSGYTQLASTVEPLQNIAKSDGIFDKPIQSSVVTTNYLYGNQGKAIINSTADADYVVLARMKSKNGYFTIGVHAERFFVYYTAKTTVDAGNNEVTKKAYMGETGNIYIDAGIIPNGGSASSLGTAALPFNAVYVNNGAYYTGIKRFDWVVETFDVDDNLESANVIAKSSGSFSVYELTQQLVSSVNKVANNIQRELNKKFARLSPISKVYSGTITSTSPGENFMLLAINSATLGTPEYSSWIVDLKILPVNDNWNGVYFVRIIKFYSDVTAINYSSIGCIDTMYNIGVAKDGPDSNVIICTVDAIVKTEIEATVYSGDFSKIDIITDFAKTTLQPSVSKDIKANTVDLNGNMNDTYMDCLIPHENDIDNYIGKSSLRYTGIYLGSSPNVSSDRNVKNSIEDLNDDLIRDFVMGLKPVSYKYNRGTSGRTHFGLIAQDVEDLLNDLNMSSLDFAGFTKSPVTEKVQKENRETEEVNVLDDEGNPKFDYGLRYEEFISPLIKMVQIQEKEIQTLREGNELLKNRLDKLESIVLKTHVPWED